ncbi:DNA pilot protein [Microviridae sp.]|nr:DNA pilot protein [Microviridae sp.]
MIDPFFGSLLAGGLSFLGGERRNKAASAQSQRQMDFQEKMSSTAHQRQVADLKAAGLNPILSARYGGSSTPGGSSAPVTNSIGEAATTAMAARRMQADVKKIEADAENAVLTGKNINADTDKKQAERQYLIQQWNESNERMMNTAQDTRNKRAQHTTETNKHTGQSLTQKQMGLAIRLMVDQLPIALQNADIARGKMPTTPAGWAKLLQMFNPLTTGVGNIQKMWK